MEVHPGALNIMRFHAERGSKARWAAYQNMALDSANAGHLQFLSIGPDNTYQEPPEQYPADNEHGMGWRYRFVGWVDLETGQVEEVKR